jgi:hypothetical protein
MRRQMPLETPRCAFGSPCGVHLCGPCRKCLAYADELEAQFWRDVFFGNFDAEGYTPAERAAQRRKRIA